MMTPAMKADAANAPLRTELKELGEKLIQLAASHSDAHVEETALKSIDKARARFELMAQEIKAQVAAAVEERKANG